MTACSLYQINNNSLLKEYVDKNNSFWCLNLDSNKLNYLSDFGLVYNNKIKYLEKFNDILSNNLIYKHINTSLQIFDFIRINNNGNIVKDYSKEKFDVLIIDEQNNDFIIKRSENTIFYFLVLEKFFLRAHGLLEPNNTSLLHQIKQLNDIEALISSDIQFGYHLKGLTAGLFDYSPALKNKKLNIQSYDFN